MRIVCHESPQDLRPERQICNLLAADAAAERELEGAGGA
jgi:hypothetical protein